MVGMAVSYLALHVSNRILEHRALVARSREVLNTLQAGRTKGVLG